MVLEVIAIRPLYGRDHLDQVLGTFGLILFFNELVRLVWGPAGMTLSLPSEMLDRGADHARRVLSGLSSGHHRGDAGGRRRCSTSW